MADKILNTGLDALLKGAGATATAGAGAAGVSLYNKKK